MRLSEAIRLGAMLAPQGFSVMFSSSPDGVVRTCALGAALQAAGYGTRGKKAFSAVEALQRWFPVTDESVSHPAYADPGHRWNLINVVIHLNDCFLWSREQIADWVEAVEREKYGALAEDSEARQAQAIEPRIIEPRIIETQAGVLKT